MQYDQFASAVAARFQLFAAGLLSSYMARVNAHANPNNVGDFRNDGYGALIVMGNEVRKLAHDYLCTVPHGARAVRTEGFHKQVDRIAQELIVMLANRLQRGAPNLGGLLTRAAGSMQQIIAQRLAKPPTLIVPDSAGRAWQADKLVHFLARDFAYQTYVEDHLETTQLAGSEKIDIVYADPSRNMTITLTDALARRAALFHPNATAMIRKHYVSL